MIMLQLIEAVNIVDSKGERALEVALKARQPSLARTLVEHHADLGAKDLNGLTLLQSAILKGDSYSAEFIIEQLENSNSSQKLCEPVRMTVTETKGSEDLTKYVGCTPLHLTAGHKTQDMTSVARRLIQAGINPNLQDNRGW